MSVKSASLAKSLHTVSAIVSVAHHLVVTGQSDGDPVVGALRILGYADAADPYQLADRAREILARRYRRYR